jgi:hypothetical protein
LADRLLRAAGALGVAALFAWGLVTLSSVPVGAEPTAAALRLSLRTAAGSLEVCRDRTPEELAALPAHMRQPRECTEVRPDYLLEVRADGARLLSSRVEPPGVHRDRPLTVDRTVAVAPGRRRLRVSFAPVAGVQEPAEGSDPLPSWTLDCTTVLPPGRVLLVALDGPQLRVARGACDPAAAPHPLTPRRD